MYRARPANALNAAMRYVRDSRASAGGGSCHEGREPGLNAVVLGVACQEHDYGGRQGRRGGGSSMR
jgi:hypothetical protein